MKSASFYWMNTGKLEKEPCFSYYYNGLSPERRQKVDAHLFEKGKRLSLAAGILLDRGLSVYGLRESDVVVKYGENGKPYLPEYPHIHFNLAYSGNRAMAVFADVETGCDIERMQKGSLGIAEKFFTPAEYAYIAKQPKGRRQDEAFYRLWTLKESFVKAVGAGLALPFNAFSVTILPDGKISVRQDVDRAFYCFEEYRMQEYFSAVCFRYEKKEGSDTGGKCGG